MKEIINTLKTKKIFIIILFLIESILIGVFPILLGTIYDTKEKNMGITCIIPEVLSVRSMNALNAINNNEELKEYYELISKGNEEYSNKYDINQREDIYILKSSINTKKLKELLVKSEALHYLFSTSDALTSKGFKPDETVINYYMGLSDDNEVKRIYSSIESMDNKTLNNHAINFVKDEYNELKLDTNKIKNSYFIKNIIFLILLSAIIIILTILNARLSTNNKYNLNILITGAPILIISIINICLINVQKLLNVGIITILLIILLILYNYLTSHKKIPNLNINLLNRTCYLIKPITIIIMNILFIFSTSNICLICYTLEYVCIILMIVDYYVGCHKLK